MGKTRSAATPSDFGTSCPEVAGFGEAPQQAFLRVYRHGKLAKIASVATLALLAG